HATMPVAADQFAYVRGLIAAEGFAVDRYRPADGRVRIHMCDTEPIDAAQAWAIEAGLNTSRGKRRAAKPHHRDQHVLTFSRHPGLLEVGMPLSNRKAIPADVMGDRNAWLPF